MKQTMINRQYNNESTAVMTGGYPFLRDNEQLTATATILQSLQDADPSVVLQKADRVSIWSLDDPEKGRVACGVTVFTFPVDRAGKRISDRPIKTWAYKHSIKNETIQQASQRYDVSVYDAIEAPFNILLAKIVAYRDSRPVPGPDAVSL